MHRRTFLKLGVQLLGLIAGLRQRWFAIAAPEHFPNQGTAYGSGPYGEGIYEGYTYTYLPLVQREED
jgi:hypothetical protein